MKKIYNYILLSVWALASVCCSDDEVVESRPLGQPGDEVQFGLSLAEFSRTIYGDEVTEKDDNGNVTSNYFPIYWVDGDKVQVYSPQCLEGRRNAEYKVSVASASQNYADELSKTGEYGVQWGSEAANFYSIYPSGDYTLATDGTIQGFTINFAQEVSVTTNSEGEKVFKPKMTDCLMYAKAENVAVGDVVNLSYKPISTAIMLTLGVDAASAVSEFTIQSINLVASEGTYIAGSFNLNYTDASFASWTEGTAKSNKIAVQLVDSSTGGFAKLSTTDGNITVPIFVVPFEGLSVEGWVVEVVTDQGTFTKTLSKTGTFNLGLKVGMAHKMILPNLSIEKEVEWDPANWMVNIPRNVYLSEVSIPGTWNSLNKDFQSDLTIGEQYAKGVRAFHIDTRWANDDVSIISRPKGNWFLGTADGTNSSNAYVDNGRWMTSESNPSFESSLLSMIENVSTDEYMVLVCSFAQDSYNYKSSNGYWYDEISAICDKYDAVYDAKNLTPNTLVGDVLRSVIVIVNMPDAITASTVLPTDSKCLFTYLPSELTAAHFSTDDNKDELWVYSTSTSEDGTTTEVAKDSEITIYNNQAQITSSTGSGISTSDRGYAPSLTERNSVLNKILDWSQSNYNTDNYAHDQWIYLGLGGYQVEDTGADAVSGSYLTIETTYNSWVNDRVEAMGANSVPYYPVGIVLMNNINGTTDYTGKTNAAGESYNFNDVVKNILLLNNKYRLQYDATKPVNYNPNAAAATSYDATATSGGNVISLD